MGYYCGEPSNKNGLIFMTIDSVFLPNKEPSHQGVYLIGSSKYQYHHQHYPHRVVFPLNFLCSFIQISPSTIKQTMRKIIMTNQASSLARRLLTHLAWVRSMPGFMCVGAGGRHTCPRALWGNCSMCFKINFKKDK